MQHHLESDKLGRELRLGSSPLLKKRRGIIRLAFFSCSVLGGIALYQVGILKKLPGPRRRWLDAEKVNGSAQAYAIAATPDALLGLVSYAVTACLAGMGAENRWQARPLVAIAMGLKVLADAAFAGRLTLEEAMKFRSFSLPSLLVAGATFAALPLALPETKAAFRQLTGGEHA